MERQPTGVHYPSPRLSLLWDNKSPRPKAEGASFAKLVGKCDAGPRRSMDEIKVTLPANTNDAVQSRIRELNPRSRRHDGALPTKLIRNCTASFARFVQAPRETREAP